MKSGVLSLTVGELARSHSAFADFLTEADDGGAAPSQTLQRWLDGLSDDRLTHIGMDRDQILDHVTALAAQVEKLRIASQARVQSLTVIGGRNKYGEPEELDLELKAGDVVCIVGPTGSGKSRLLADIECLAQGDTPSGRRVLVNGSPPDPGWRYASDRKLIAQLSQNMNFVVDLTVGEFISMHAGCRMVEGREAMVRDVIACANELAGEPFSADMSVTQLSGGQSRALMIADTALLSASPVVLIDEIENAGVDRKRSLELLIAKEKIVLISTHDPILALMGDRRIVVRNGAVASVIETTGEEKANLKALEHIDRSLMALRRRLRAGERIAAPLNWAFNAGKD